MHDRYAELHAKACWLILGAFGCRAELDAVAVLGSMQPHILDYQPVNDNYLQVFSASNSDSAFCSEPQLTAKLASHESPFTVASQRPAALSVLLTYRAE